MRAHARCAVTAGIVGHLTDNKTVSIMAYGCSFLAWGFLMDYIWHMFAA